MSERIDPHTIKVGDIVATCYGRVCSYCIVLTPLDSKGDALVHMCKEDGNDLPYKVNDRQWNFLHNNDATSIMIVGHKDV